MRTTEMIEMAKKFRQKFLKAMSQNERKSLSESGFCVCVSEEFFQPTDGLPPKEEPQPSDKQSKSIGKSHTDFDVKPENNLVDFKPFSTITNLYTKNANF